MAKLAPKPKSAPIKAPPQEAGSSKVKAVATVAVEVEGVRTSDDLLAERGMYTCHAPPGHGKTFFALTGSVYCPKDLSKKTTPTAKVLDAVWMACDRGATAGFKERGVLAPYIVDLNYIMRPPLKNEKKPYADNILDALPLMIDLAYQVFEQAGTIKWIVVDTVSSIDRQLNAYWEDHVPTSKAGKEDRFAMYRMIGKYHSQFYDAMSLFPCNVMFLAHTKAQIESDDTTQQLKQRAAASAGDNELTPSITGKSLETYTANVDVEFALEALQEPGWKPGDPAAFKRYVYPIGGKKMRGKNRFQLSLGTKEPADLGLIMARIRGG